MDISIIEYIKYYSSWALNTQFGLYYQTGYSEEWDTKLNKLLDNVNIDTFVNRSPHPEYTLIIEDVEIWIQKDFCAYGFDFNKAVSDGIRSMGKRPKVKTMFRLAKFVSILEEK